MTNTNITIGTVIHGTLRDENVIDIECQVHIHTNDHGNVTVSELRGKEIWSAV